MVIIGLRLPSGWQAVESSVKKLEQSQNLRRFEINENRLSLYFDEVFFDLKYIFYLVINFNYNKVNRKRKRF